jgi:hypothetical protein
MGKNRQSHKAKLTFPKDEHGPFSTARTFPVTTNAQQRAAIKTMPDFDPYHKWLGIQPEEQPANYYRLLGLVLFEDDPDAIASAADQRMVHIRSFQGGKHANLSQKILNEIAAARICLLNSSKKAAYDQRLRGQLPPPPPIAKAAEHDQKPPLQLPPLSIVEPVEYEKQFSSQLPPPPIVEADDFSDMEIPRVRNAYKVYKKKPSGLPWVFACIGGIVVVVIVFLLGNTAPVEQEVAKTQVAKTITANPPARKAQIEKSMPTPKPEIKTQPKVELTTPTPATPTKQEENATFVPPPFIPSGLADRPIGADRVKAENDVRSLFFTAIEAAKLPAQKAKVATDVLKVAQQRTNNDAERFELLLLAKNLAVEGHDKKTAWEASIAIAKGYKPKLAEGSNDGKVKFQKAQNLWRAAQDGKSWRERLKLEADAIEWYARAKTDTSSTSGIGRLEKSLCESKIAEGLGAGVAAKADNDTPATRAVRKGLEWLISQQQSDGHWTFITKPNPGNLANSPCCATAMALIPLLRAGYTHRSGEHQEVINNGLKFLTSLMTVNKNIGNLFEPDSKMYGQAICTIALCEAYHRTHDQKLREKAQAAINFIVCAQDPKGGGWRYEPRQGGDTSVTGWQLTALSIAKAAKLQIPRETFVKADSFLNAVQMGGGASYGYAPGDAGGPANTSVGLLCRIHLGCKKDHPALQRGMIQVNDQGPSPDNMYFNYYGTQLMRNAQPDQWFK